MFKKALLILVILMSVGSVHAISIEPNSPAWRIDTFIERVNLLISSSERKVKLRLSYADERLDEAELMRLTGRIDDMERALSNYNIHIDRMRVEVKEVDDVKERFKLELKIKNKMDTHVVAIERLQLLVDDLDMPEQSKRGLKTALESVRSNIKVVEVDISSDVKTTRARVVLRYGDVEASGLEELSEGKISDEKLKSLVVRANDLSSKFPEKLVKQSDGSYEIVVVDAKDGVLQRQGFLVKNGVVSLVACPCDFVMTVDSDDVLDLVDAVEGGDIKKLIGFARKEFGGSNNNAVVANKPLSQSNRGKSVLKV